MQPGGSLLCLWESTTGICPELKSIPYPHIDLFKVNFLTYLHMYLLSYLHTYLLTPWCRIFFENSVITRLVKQEPAFFMKA
jgi:hypothetical protein